MRKMPFDYELSLTNWQRDTQAKLTKMLGYPVKVDRHGMAKLQAAHLVLIAESLQHAERDIHKLTDGLPY